MIKFITITDVTRMREGRVCVAGYDNDRVCIRPVLPQPGIHERTLFKNKRPYVFPFAEVEYELLRPHPQPPHTEDYLYDPTRTRFVRRLDEEQRKALLKQTLFPDLYELFETPILFDLGFYILDGKGPRSLGTIEPKQVIGAFYERLPEGKWKYRLRFMDQSRTAYTLTITDLAWRYYCDFQRESGSSPSTISNKMSSILKLSRVYLRIGLARSWEKFPDRCYIQITGVYTFPDYLNGKTFADFAPKQESATT